MAKFHQVAAIRDARSIPKGGDQVRACAVQDFGRAAVRSGSSTEMLRLSITGLLFPKKADAGVEVPVRQLGAMSR
jgi:hypothetical protein